MIQELKKFVGKKVTPELREEIKDVLVELLNPPQLLIEVDVHGDESDDTVLHVDYKIQL